jgi:hypothetical protein
MTFTQMIVNRIAWRLVLLGSRLMFLSDPALPNPLHLEFRAKDRSVTLHRSATRSDIASKVADAG